MRVTLLAALALTGSAFVMLPTGGTPAAGAECVEPGVTTMATVKPRTLGPVTVPVVFHVVHRSDGTGNLPDATIAAQMAELNEDFAGREAPGEAADTGFSFRQQAIHRWQNDHWYDNANDSNVIRAMQAATREGRAATLNIWTTNLPHPGESTFPWDYEQRPLADGVVLRWAVMPGETATHEAGHWLGLFHTFENGCSEDNDLVADTPAHVWPSWECPIGDDTCDLPGLDPIHNYMSYADDSCRNQFTPGQAVRAHENWAAYRD